MLLIKTWLPIAKFDLFMSLLSNKLVFSSMAQVQSFSQLKMAISGNSKWQTMEKILLFMYEKCRFPSHNDHLEFDGGGKYS